MIHTYGNAKNIQGKSLELINENHDVAMSATHELWEWSLSPTWI